MLEEPINKSVKKKPSERVYRKAAIALAFDAVQIDPCRECGWPHLEQYCCTYCGSVNP